MFFPSFSDIQHEDFVLLQKIFRPSCRNFLPRVHRNSFKEKKLFWKKLSFLSFSDIERKNFGSWRKISDVVVNNLSYVAIATILKKIFFKKILIFLSFSNIEQKNFDLLPSVFRPRFQGSTLRVHGSCFRKKNFLGKIYFGH